MGLGFLGVGVLGTCLSWGLLVYLGRRTIYNNGLALPAALQLLIGVLDFVPDKANKLNVICTQASILIIWNFIYNLTIEPLGFSILCEASAAHVREKTIAFRLPSQPLLVSG
jgi:MFS transporter, SP family, general alpha glucoside:H+ symporter